MTVPILYFSPRSWKDVVGLAGLWATLQGFAAPALAASSLVEQQISTSQTAIVAQSVDQAYALYQRSQELLQTGRYAEAIPLAEQALSLAEAEFGHEHNYTAGVLNQLAKLYRLVGRYSEAEPLHHRALAICE